MKKLVMILVCMFAVHTIVMADNDKPQIGGMEEGAMQTK